jgi:hypothetical protein
LRPISYDIDLSWVGVISGHEPIETKPATQRNSTIQRKTSTVKKMAKQLKMTMEKMLEPQMTTAQKKSTALN